MLETVSIIIPTHKRALSAIALVESIAGQDFPYQNLQILLISNLKDKKLRERASHFESLFFDFKYKEVGSKGVNKARNLGIRFAGGDILYFLDDDCLLPHKKHLKNLVQEHKNHPLAMGIGAQYKTLEPLNKYKKTYHVQHLEWIQKHKSEGLSQQLIGGNASYKREVFDRGFNFNPSIVFGGAEESFNQSLIEQGYSLLNIERLWVFHKIKLGFFSFLAKSFQQGLGLFKNRQSKQSIKSLRNIEKEWAFFAGSETDFFLYFYSLFFKLGYFYGLAGGKFLGGRFFRFVFLLLKSRFYFFKQKRFFGHLYFVMGWIYGSILLRGLGLLWFVIGWLYGSVLLRGLGFLWFVIGWLYGSVLLRGLGFLWFVIGWLYGSVLLRGFGFLWFVIGWLYGSVLLRGLGLLWFVIGWLYGSILLRGLGILWFVIGWLYGSVLLRGLGFLYFAVGSMYALILRSSLMKIYYFSKFQYYKRIIKSSNRQKNSRQ